MPGSFPRLTESRSGLGEFLQFAFLASFLPVILMLIKYEKQYNRILIKNPEPLYQERGAFSYPPPSTRQPVLKSCGLCLLCTQIPCSPFSWLHFLATASPCVSILGKGLITTNSTDSCPFSHLKSLLCVLITTRLKSELIVSPSWGHFCPAVPPPLHTFEPHTPCAST